jgi:hypothetical protein
MKTMPNNLLRESTCVDSCRNCVDCRNGHKRASVSLLKILAPCPVFVARREEHEFTQKQAGAGLTPASPDR